MIESTPPTPPSLSTEHDIEFAEDFEWEFSEQSGPQVITFKLGDETYGINILETRELITYPTGEVTPIPGTPEFIVGVINLRGVVIPVMDLRIRFNFSEAIYDDDKVIVIVEVEGKQIGLIVDSVSDVAFIVEDQVQSVEHFSSGIDTAYISGIVEARETMLILLDIQQLLSRDELNSLVRIDSRSES